MRHLILAACVAAAAPFAFSADPPKDAPVDTSFLRKYAETRGFMLGRPAKPKFTPDGKHVLFLRSEATRPRQTLFEFDVATGKTKELLSPELLLKGASENLSPEEKARRERQRVTVGGFADYHLDPDGKRVLVMLSGRPYVFDRTIGTAREIAAGSGTVVDPKWSPDGKFVSYVRDHDVYAFDLAANKELAVTTGGTAVKTHGLAEFVAQEEMDRFTGYWWSPDSKHIAYEEADHAGVEVWHIADPSKPGVKPQEQYYPRPGKKNVSVRLGIKPVAGGETVWVEWDRKGYEYLATVHWDPLGPLTIQVQDREQQELRLLRVDKATGKIELLIRNADHCFTNIYPHVPQWFQNGESFLWVSEWDCTGHLAYQCPDEHELELRHFPPKRPTGENLDLFELSENLHFFGVPGFREILSVNPADGETAVSASRVTPKPDKSGYEIDPTQNRLFLTNLVRLDGNKEPTAREQAHRPLAAYDEPGVYTATFSPRHNAHAVTKTTLDRLSETHVWSGSKRLGELPSTAEKPPFTPNVTIQKVGDYWTAVVRPRNFDPKKKYPVVVDVYGGPHHLHVQQAMRNWLIPQWLADQGFVVVAIDNHGTPGRGRRWERRIYQSFGTVPLEDQVKGLHLLGEKFPELDLGRVGIVGWSFGGYMAANAVLRRPDVFRAAAAGAPVTDWEDYDTHYTERYLGLLPESKKAYEEASLLPLAPKLERPLLLVHGTADDNVYYRHTLRLADALFRAGKEFEVLPLPGVTHQYSADPLVAERLWGRTVTFFKRHLGEAK